MNRLEGEQAAFQTAEDRKKLVGKVIKYLRQCDIDKSGRGYFFPRVDVVIDAKGRQLILSNWDSLSAGDLVELVIVGNNNDGKT